MREYEKSVIPFIESKYDGFTTVEKSIADFFINNRKEQDFSAQRIAGLLYTSKASLSRFAKKIGFSGYREFIYEYQASIVEEPMLAEGYVKEILTSYQELLNKSYNLINDEQMQRVASEISKKKRVFVYGMGSSGLAAKEFESRFMRMGVDVESVTDSHMLTMNSVRLNENCLVIGISISGTTKEVITALGEAKGKGATTILVTSKNSTSFQSAFDELILVSVRENLDYGNVISPQFPVLVVMDAIYANYLQEDRKNREALYDYTLSAILERNN